ncbi:hypothetical protein NQT62_04055 [Limnobacter humi]|uniref:DUF2842 domain-containing protein n=1 Tax=Limnobacter humi TaxID=1778671 RepID=A0ABT1WDL8_9BURK|nr:hypothetical protein [Limnobacter humi]MCQ8895615.1 hypothetical protein [Limnobacter humi]
MNVKHLFNNARKWTAVTCIAIGTGIFYGAVAAILVKFGLRVSENEALLYAGLPVAVVVAILIWPRLPKILGFHD